MQLRQIVSLAVCLGVIAVCGCGENGSNPDKEKVTSCSVTDFKPTCVGVISYEVCEERVVVTRSCPSDQKCTDGACTPIQPGERICNDDDYVSECRDLGYTICTDGQLSTIPCQNGETCKAGKCVQGTNTPGVPSGGNPPSGTKPTIPETCNDDVMVPYCYDNIRLSCKDGKVVQTDCSSLGLACHYGECKAPSNLPCTPTIDKPQCVGNVLISCDYESFKLESRPCGDNICTTVDGVPNCYTPCQASASSSDYSNYCWGIDAYVKARCAESDDHHNVIVDIQKEEDDYYNYKDCPENEFCSEGKCAPQYSGFTQGCSANDKEFCERNIAYSCTKDWFDKYHWNATTCGVDTCVVYEDKARCAKSCSKALEGVTRNYCHYDDYDVSLASVTETCRKIEDGFYWVQDEKTGCSACNEYTGKCITHELVCDENSQNCYDPDRESCDASKDSERYRCVQGDSYRSGGSYNYPYDSVTEECIDGYWTVTNSDSCRLNGCDVKTGKCNDYSGSIHEKCTDSTDYCAYEGYVVGCEFESRNKILLSCGSGQCAQTNDDSFHCVVPCAAEDLGKIVYSECQGSNQSVYFECVKNYYGVGPEYYLLAHSETCQNGCQDGTCRGKIHPDDDRYCSQDYQFNCLNDVEAGCSGYFSPSVIAHDCREENRICVASGENNGCFEPCTEADYKKQNLLCVKNDNDEIYSQGRNCLKAGDGRYFWTPEVDEHCIHGCTEKTGECITIHELEGQSCNISTDSKCDGKYRLYCWFDYTAYDCEEQLGAGATCAMMNEGADDAEPACILPCKHVGDTKPVCESQDYEVQYSCVDTGGVKHWENDDTVNEYCKRGCDADTGKCIKLNEHEGQSCNADTDPEFCDGSNYIYCHWSEYDIGDCNEEAKDTMCALENGKTECLYPCTKAELGNSRKQCGTGWAHARLYDAVCTEFENGYFWKTGEDFISCDHDCDASTLTCTKIVTDEYERCDINSYTPSCHDNHLIYCDKSSNKVLAKECYSNEMCFSSETLKANCYDTCESKDAGKSSAYCGYSGILKVTTCTKAGTNYLQIPQETFCYHGCNETKDACDVSPYTAGDSCESLSLTKCADDTHYYTCKDDVIALAECESGTVCTNRGWSNAVCEVPECTEGHIQYKCNGSDAHTVLTCGRNSYGSYAYQTTTTAQCADGCEEATNLCY